MAISTAILVFEGVQIIDYTGPYEALGRRGPTYLVAERRDALATNMGMQVVPNHAFLGVEAIDPESAASAQARQRVTVEVVRVDSAA